MPLCVLTGAGAHHPSTWSHPTGEVSLPPPGVEIVPLVDNAPVLRFGEPVKVCKRCNNYKPFMSHHCSTCKRCVRLMDHHCSTLGLAWAGGPWGRALGLAKALGWEGSTGQATALSKKRAPWEWERALGDVRGRACERASGANCDHVG